MANKLHLTLACGDYEIVAGLKDGTIKPDGIELTVLTDMDSSTRHWRMARYRHFDVCEFSMSSYLLAKFKNEALTAIPVFPHRRFRHGFIFVNSAKGINKPTDLIGKDVGLTNFQTTTLVWTRGILEDEFQVPHKSIRWHAQKEEDVEFTPPEGLLLSRVPDGANVDRMLADGKLDALIHPELPVPILENDPRVKRLFENYKELEIEYYRRTGIFPIMHTTVIKQEIVDRHPWVPWNLLVAFERAKKLAYQKIENPRSIPHAWFQTAGEEQRKILGNDPWEFGLTLANRKNLEKLIDYSHHQGIIGRRLSLDELFDASTKGTEWSRPLSKR
jgi:4,5-dihydroxyphthalate decarboxylase